MIFTTGQILGKILNSAVSAIQVAVTGAFSPPPSADTATFEYPSDTVDVVKYRSGGASGTVLMTLTTTYVDNTKAQISKVERS